MLSVRVFAYDIIINICYLSQFYRSAENCVLRIPGSQTKCVPLKNKSEFYVNADLKNETVQTILTCGCNSA